MLRVRPHIGRHFTADDDRVGAPAVVILSYDVWQSRYGGEPSILGRTVRVNSVPATIIAVMPPRFTYPGTAQIWQPLSALAPSAVDRRVRNLTVVGRLGPGVDPEAATAELQNMLAQIAMTHPETHKDLRLIVPTLQEAVGGGGQAWRILATLMGAVTFVLLIACANVASLLLARAAHRSREIAVRSALGASRWRIVRQLLVECVLIAGLAALAGLSLSRFLSGLMASAFDAYDPSAPGPMARPYWVDISVDGLTLVFLGTVALFASVAVGLVPSWHLAKTNPNDVLKDGGRTGGTTARARRMTGALLVGQLALTLMLLTSAGLLIRGFFTQYFTDPVLDADGIVTMRIVLPAEKYARLEQQRRFVSFLDERLAGLPAFSSIAIATDIPLQPFGFASRSLAIDGRSWAAEKAPTVFYVAVGPRYFETFRLPLVQGRSLMARDGLAGQQGAVVSQQLADRFFAHGDAIGQRIQLVGPSSSQAAPWLTIVGVSAALPTLLPERGTELVVFVPFDADPGPHRAVMIAVRTADRALGQAAAAAVLREQVTAMDADLPVFGIQTLDEAMAAGLALGIPGAWGMGRLLEALHGGDSRDPLTLALVSALLITVALCASIWPARRAARVDPAITLRAD